MAKGTVTVKILGDAKSLQSALGESEGRLGKFAKVGAAAVAGLATAAVGVGVGLFKIGESFDDAYDTIRVGTGATGKALDALQADFKQVVQGVPTDFGTASTAVADLNTRLGLTGKPLQDMSKQFLELSRITETDVATNIASVTRVFGDWGIAAEDQAGALDGLFRASQATGIGVDALSQKVVQFGAPMRQFGFSFEQSAALMGKWEKEGVNTEAIMGGLRAGLGKLAKAGKDPVKAFQDISKQIMNAGSAGEATAIAIATFGQRAGPDLAAAVREGRFEIDDLVDTIKNGDETIIGAGKATQDFGEKMTMLKNRVFVALEPVAMRVFDAVGSGLDRLSAWWTRNGPTVIAWAESVKRELVAFADAAIPVIRDLVDNVLTNLSKWWDDNGPRVIAAAIAVKDAVVGAFQGVVEAVGFVVEHWDKFKFAVAAGVAIMVPHFVALGVAATVSSVQQVAAWVATGAKAAWAAIAHSGHVVAMVAKWVFLGIQALLHAGKVAAAWLIAMGPIGLVIAAVAGAVALIIIHFDTIKKTIGDAWEWVKTKTSDAWNALTAWLASTWGALTSKVSETWKTITATISQKWEEIKTTTTNAIGSVVQFFRELPGKVVGAVQAGAQALVELGGWVVGRLRDGVTGMAGTIFGWFLTLPVEVGRRIEAGAQVLFDVGKRIVGIIVDGIKSIPNAIGNALMDVAKGGGGFLSNVLSGRIAGINDAPASVTGVHIGGKTLARVQGVLGQFPGARITSTYRSPEQNRRVGGSPTSHHMDRVNPAVDIAGPSAVLDRMAVALARQGGWRQLLWRVKGHYDHIHVAHKGGTVTPDGIAPLKPDEILTKLQVGETVLPRGTDTGAPPVSPEVYAKAIARALEPLLVQRMRAA